MLKKEFKERDVQRARNLLTNKAGDRTAIQAGYEKETIDRKEGDVWEESGKKWTIKNGIRQTVTKLDSLKKLVVLPLACPTCNKSMKITDLNKKMYAIHGKCFDCVIEMETRLKAEGKYLEYEKKMLNGNKNSYLTDLEQALDDWMKESNTFVSEDGEVEGWSKVVKDQDTYKELKELIQKRRESEI